MIPKRLGEPTMRERVSPFGPFRREDDRRIESHLRHPVAEVLAVVRDHLHPREASFEGALPLSVGDLEKVADDFHGSRNGHG